MSATNQNPESDSLKIDYNEETSELIIEWDSDDPQWNWLASKSQEEIKQAIMSFIEEM